MLAKMVVNNSGLKVVRTYREGGLKQGKSGVMLLL